MLNPYKCVGSYIFNNSVYEEKVTCSALLELSKAEKGIKEVKIGGETIEAAQIYKSMKKDSIVEFIYQPEAESNNAKEEIGEKFLNWRQKHI